MHPGGPHHSISSSWHARYYAPMQPPCAWVVSPVWPPWPPSKPIFTNNLIRSPRFPLVTCRCLARTNKHTMKLAGNKAEPRTVWKRRKLEILGMENEKNKTNTTPQHQFSDGHQSVNDPGVQSISDSCFAEIPSVGKRYLCFRMNGPSAIIFAASNHIG